MRGFDQRLECRVNIHWPISFGYSSAAGWACESTPGDESLVYGVCRDERICEVLYEHIGGKYHEQAYQR